MIHAYLVLWRLHLTILCLPLLQQFTCLLQHLLHMCIVAPLHKHLYKILNTTFDLGHMFQIRCHSLSECGFEIQKTYQAPAHIWDLPRWWKSLLLMYKIFQDLKTALRDGVPTLAGMARLETPVCFAHLISFLAILSLLFPFFSDFAHCVCFWNI